MAAQTIQYSGNNYAHITTAVTTVVKANPALFVGLSINNGAAGTATVYDNTAASGTIIAVINTAVQNALPFSVPCRIGLTVVTSGTADLTVLFI